jgi:citrate synthase
LARTAGWLAHWREQLHDPLPIFRPFQHSLVTKKEFVPMIERPSVDGQTIQNLLEKQSARKFLRK